MQQKMFLGQPFFNYPIDNTKIKDKLSAVPLVIYQQLWFPLFDELRLGVPSWWSAISPPDN